MIFHIYMLESLMIMERIVAFQVSLVLKPGCQKLLGLLEALDVLEVKTFI